MCIEAPEDLPSWLVRYSNRPSPLIVVGRESTAAKKTRGHTARNDAPDKAQEATEVEASNNGMLLEEWVNRSIRHKLSREVDML